MCYNYSNRQTKDEFKFHRKYLKAVSDLNDNKFTAYHTNGFNHQELPVITQNRPDEIQYYRWGLVPFFIKDIAGAKDIWNKTLNARSESVFETASFKKYIGSQRCLIPATGFFEWHTELSVKYPYHIMVKDDDFPDSTRSFCFGGLYNNWVDKSTGEVFNTFTILTTPANGVMSFIHNSAKRMPFILPLELEQEWLNPDLNDSQIKSMMKPYDNSKLVAHTISKLITSRTENPNQEKILDVFEYNSASVPTWITSSDVGESNLFGY